jgi:hypothetical protein
MKSKNLILLLLFAFAAVFTGCQSTLDKSGPYAGDQILYNADQTIATAYDVLDTFVHWEKANQSSLPKSVHDSAEKIRVNAPGWFKSATNLRKAYVAEPTPENRLKLSNAVGILRTALTEATGYLIENNARTSALALPGSFPAL